MIHDGEGNPCRKTEGNIMSPTLAGNNGVFSWSTCSRQYLSRFLGLGPTQTNTSCQIRSGFCYRLLWLTWVMCCVHQNSPGILSGGWAQADWTVQVPWTASRAAVQRRHTVQVAVWLKGQTLQPWFCQGEISSFWVLDTLSIYCCFYLMLLAYL